MINGKKHTKKQCTGLSVPSLCVDAISTKISYLFTRFCHVHYRDQTCFFFIYYYLLDPEDVVETGA